MRIDSLNPNPIASITSTPVAPAAAEKGAGFGEMLMDVLKEVNGADQKAGAMKDAYLTGQPVEIHDLMIALEKSSLGMQLTMQVRNKLLEGYQEISRMQV